MLTTATTSLGNGGASNALYVLGRNPELQEEGRRRLEEEEFFGLPRSGGLPLRKKQLTWNGLIVLTITCEGIKLMRVRVGCVLREVYSDVHHLLPMQLSLVLDIDPWPH